MDRTARTRSPRHLAFVVAVAATLGGCVRLAQRDTRSRSRTTTAPCSSGEPCTKGVDPDNGEFGWATEVMESAR